MNISDNIIAITSHALLVIMWQLELSKRDSSAILVSLRNRRVRQDVTSQFNGSSRIFAVAKGRLSDPDTSRTVFINEYHACVFSKKCYTKSIIDSSFDPQLLGIVIEDHDGAFYR